MPTTIVQPPTRDTDIRLSSPDNNYGSVEGMYVLSGPANAIRALMDFSIPSLPSGATLICATLYLYYYSKSPSDPVGRTYWANRITQNWLELEATWNDRVAGTPWINPGGTYTTTDAASATVPASFGWMSWNVLALAQDAIDNRGGNLRLLIKDEVEDSSPNYSSCFYSKEYTGDPSLQPKVVLYYWLPHAALDGQYAVDSPRVNRAYVVGRDQNGNPVYGTAVDSTELGLVGERLDFQQELSIPTDSEAQSVANAILSKMRLSGKRGVILIPPNCGQELWDVVQITDTQGNQSAVTFRVVGIRFEYNPMEARYQHKLILGAP